MNQRTLYIVFDADKAAFMTFNKTSADTFQWESGGKIIPIVNWDKMKFYMSKLLTPKQNESLYTDGFIYL